MCANIGLDLFFGLRLLIVLTTLKLPGLCGVTSAMPMYKSVTNLRDTN